MARSIAFIGGTGPEGKGLAARFAQAGIEVFIGSRAAEKGQEAAREVADRADGRVRGGTNADAVEAGEIILVTIPYAGMRETLSGLRSQIGQRIVISAVVPLQFSRTRVAAIEVPDGSAAQEAQNLLPEARLVGAFQNLSAGHLLDLAHPIDGDVIVCSDDAGALSQVMELAGRIEGVRGINGGPLANSHYVEELTALLLNINRINKAETHVKIVGV